ncbi:exopolysaccharide biosynthesis protein [Rhizobium sp. RU36D]|uniref:exopolysaccharide biosynthesis protein n=1 Tax=Rhizobium sp. RU36D TaxID=1907415 RepID=UPI0009D7E93A|nr:exopolysaccharide biosynthesis protein [Rhizobium sp. RU36D]SMC39445.1 Uncharacterized conserved protein [Rhizobium sp. RU36D]
MGIEFTDSDKSTSAVLADVIASIGNNEHVTLRTILTQMGENGLLLLCALLSLPFLFPVSIPGVSTVFGAGIVLIGIAIMMNSLPWLPARIADRKLESRKLVPVLERGLAIVTRVNRYLRPRMLGLTGSVLMNRFNGFVLTGAGLLLMAPLGFVPFSNTLPGVAILLMSVGISQRDGAVVAGGYVMVVLTIVYMAVLAFLAVSAGQTLYELGN